MASPLARDFFNGLLVGLSIGAEWGPQIGAQKGPLF